jgi:hypothetical protein
VDGDGLPDVVQANSGDLGGTPGFLAVYFGLADGGLSTPRLFGSGAFFAVALDPDGGAALAAVPASFMRREVDLFASDGSPLGVYATQGQPAAIAAADMNDDGRIDLVTCEDPPELLLNLGGGAFSGQAQMLGPWDGWGCTAMAAADLNWDNRPDLVLGGPQVGVMRSQPDGGFFTDRYPWGASEARSVALQDLNGDGLIDVVLVGDPGFHVALNKYYGLLGDPAVYPAGASPQQVPPNHLVVADFNGDCRPDVVVTSGFGCNPGNGVITLFLGRGDGTFSEGTSIASGLPTPYGIVAYQGAGAALPSIVAADICSGQLELLPNLGSP